MPLQATSGAASYDAFGGGVAAVPQYIEDVFSTWLYTGNGATQTINNGIDLAGKGGLVWLMTRVGGRTLFYDTVRGPTKQLIANLTNAESTVSAGINAFTSTGFTTGNDFYSNNSGTPYTPWTFREQPKFFDVVTYTGTDSFGFSPQTIAHNLGSVPGCILIKSLTGGGVAVYHRGMVDAKDSAMTLNTSSGKSIVNWWGSVAPSSTSFNVNGSGTNTTGSAYIAYIFAHNAGGFGLSGTDNVISCGSYTGNGSTNGPVVTLGYEPQWLMIKNSTGTGDWQIIDDMRGMSVNTNDAALQANLANAEVSVDYVSPTATGFQVVNGSSEVNTSSSTYIYIAIRRGPMKVPTTGTSVFSLIASSATTGTNQTTGFPVDMQIKASRAIAVLKGVADRLRGVGTTPSSDIGVRVSTNLINAETPSTDGGNSKNWTNTGFANPSDTGGISAIYWSFRRAPSYFDEVCYTGTGANRTVTHNLGVAPELWIVKGRSGSTAWQVGSTALANTEYVVLNTTAAKATGATRWNSTYPTSSVFSLGTATEVNTSSATYVAYLFATCAGVSKVGSYTGTGATQTIDCGFTGGARFVMIKRTDTTGSWYVWDTARGMVAGTDPSITLNSTGTDSNVNDVYTTSVGFQLVSAFTGSNASGGTYIFLAIA